MSPTGISAIKITQNNLLYQEGESHMKYDDDDVQL